MGYGRRWASRLARKCCRDDGVAITSTHARRIESSKPSYDSLPPLFLSISLARTKNSSRTLSSPCCTTHFPHSRWSCSFRALATATRGRSTSGTSCAFWSSCCSSARSTRAGAGDRFALSSRRHERRRVVGEVGSKERYRISKSACSCEF